MPHTAEIHVIPHERTGGWCVQPGDGDEGQSWHATAHEAQSAALRRAAARGAREVFVHDRYRRVRRVTRRSGTPSPAGS